MQAGDLCSRVGFYKREDLSDSSPDTGNLEGEFPDEPEFTSKAMIKPRLGGEGVLAGRLSGRHLVNITVRNCDQVAEVNEEWKARDMRKGVDYNIRDVIDPFEGDHRRGRWVEFLCEVGVAV